MLEDLLEICRHELPYGGPLLVSNPALWHHCICDLIKTNIGCCLFWSAMFWNLIVSSCWPGFLRSPFRSFCCLIWPLYFKVCCFSFFSLPWWFPEPAPTSCWPGFLRSPWRSFCCLIWPHPPAPSQDDQPAYKEDLDVNYHACRPAATSVLRTACLFVHQRRADSCHSPRNNKLLFSAV